MDTTGASRRARDESNGGEFGKRLRSVARYIFNEWVIPIFVAMILVGGILGPKISSTISSVVADTQPIWYPLMVAAIAISTLAWVRRHRKSR